MAILIKELIVTVPFLPLAAAMFLGLKSSYAGY